MCGNRSENRFRVKGAMFFLILLLLFLLLLLLTDFHEWERQVEDGGKPQFLRGHSVWTEFEIMRRGKGVFFVKHLVLFLSFLFLKRDINIGHIV